MRASSFFAGDKARINIFLSESRVSTGHVQVLGRQPPGIATTRDCNRSSRTNVLWPFERRHASTYKSGGHAILIAGCGVTVSVIG